MKKIIIIFTIFLIASVANSQEFLSEYKVFCKRVTGCPVVNGTCPSCEIVQNGKTVKQFEYDAWGKKLNQNLKFLWESSLENDPPSKKQNGWDYEGPYWKGLRVGG